MLGPGEDAALDGDKGIHDRDMEWLMKSDGERSYHMFIILIFFIVLLFLWNCNNM